MSSPADPELRRHRTPDRTVDSSSGEKVQRHKAGRGILWLLVPSFSHHAQLSAPRRPRHPPPRDGAGHRANGDLPGRRRPRGLRGPAGCARPGDGAHRLRLGASPQSRSPLTPHGEPAVVPGQVFSAHRVRRRLQPAPPARGAPLPESIEVRRLRGCGLLSGIGPLPPPDSASLQAGRRPAGPRPLPVVRRCHRRGSHPARLAGSPNRPGLAWLNGEASGARGSGPRDHGRQGWASRWPRRPAIWESPPQRS